MTVTAAYSEMGLSVEQTTKIVESATMAYDMSGEQTTALLLSFKDMNTELGVPVQQLASDYAALQSSMSYNIDRINSEFKKLSTTARATGIPVSKLTEAFGTQMDTFAGSSEKAGKLNAILGGSFINSMELLGKTESERVEYIKGAIDSAGVSLQSLTAGKGFGLKALASEMGLSPEDTRKLLSGKSEEVMSKLRESGADPEKPLINSQKDLTSATKDLTNALVASKDPTEQYRIQMRRSLDDAMVRREGLDQDSFSRFRMTSLEIDRILTRSKEEGRRGQMQFFQQFEDMDPNAVYAILNTQQNLLIQLKEKTDKYIATLATTKSTTEALDSAGITPNQPKVSAAQASQTVTQLGGDPSKFNLDGSNPFSQASGADQKVPLELVINLHGKGEIARIVDAHVSPKR